MFLGNCKRIGTVVMHACYSLCALSNITRLLVRTRENSPFVENPLVPILNAGSPTVGLPQRFSGHTTTHIFRQHR